MSRFVTQVEKSGNSAMGEWFCEIRCITVHLKNHITGCVLKGGLRMSVTVVHELMDGISGGSGGFKLLSSQCRECMKDG